VYANGQVLRVFELFLYCFRVVELPAKLIVLPAKLCVLPANLIQIYVLIGLCSDQRI